MLGGYDYMSCREVLDYSLMLEQMNKGFMVCRALYDNENRVVDFEYLSVSKGMEDFAFLPKSVMLSKKLLADRLLPELGDPLMLLFTEVLTTGQASRALLHMSRPSKAVNAFAFQTQPHHVACYLEYCDDHQTTNIVSSYLKRNEFMHTAEDGFWVRKGDNVLFANAAFEKLFGIPWDQLNHIDDFLEIVDERDREKVRDIMKQDATRLRTNFNAEFRIRRLSDGMTRWIWMKTFYQGITSNSCACKSAVFIDVTSKKHAEEELLRSNREILLLNELFKKASEHVDFNELMLCIQRLLMEYMSVDVMGIHLYDELQRHLNFRYTPNIPDEMLKQGEFYTKIQELLNWVHENKTSISITTSELPEGKLKQMMVDYGIQYINSFPILYSGACVGVMILGNIHRDLTYKEKDFIMAVCNQLAVLINHSKLYEELIRELEMRQNVERQNKLIFDNSIDLIAIMNDNMELLRIGPQWQKCLGWSEEEVLSKSLMTLVHAEDREKTLEYIDTLMLEGVAMGIEHRLMCKDGSYRWIAWNAHIVKESQKDLIIMIGRDMTLSKEIEEKNRNLEKAYHMETVRMEFFANISHEFRTPLNIILSALQLIDYSLKNKENGACITERELRHFKSIKQNAIRLLRLVNNLIDITKLDSGYMKLYAANHDIVKITRSITESVDQYIEGKGIKLIFETNVPKKIIACDADMIERILLNLLSNAVKYTEKDGFIRVSVTDAGNVVKISVKDSGVGIPEEMLDLIFERFIQIEKPLSRRCEGSGIGLALAKALVELHKGRIYVNSTLHQGSEFTFELPVVILENEPCHKGIEPSREERIHRINVEFSDIYSLNL